MSAWVVSKAHIDALVNGALQVGGTHGDRYFYFYHANTRHEVKPSNVSEIGQALVDECVRSVSDCYPNDDVSKGELPGPVDAYYNEPYRFDFTRALSDGEIAHAVACYEYQSCEHNEWKASKAHAFCEAMRYRLITRIPGYNEAPWGFDEEHVRPQATSTI